MKLSRALANQNCLSTLFELKTDKWLRQLQHREQSKRPAKTFHASSLVTEPKDFCARRKIYDYLQSDKKKAIQSELSATTRKVFYNGNIHHAKWQSLFLSAKVADKIEVTHYSKKWHLTGTPDAIIWLHNKLYVCEIKTMNTYIFKKTKSVPKAAMIQANIYMYLTGIPRAVVLIDDKNDHNIKTFWIDFDPTVIYTYLSQHAEVIYYYKKKKIPPKTCVSSLDLLAKKCKYCERCFNE